MITKIFATSDLHGNFDGIDFTGVDIVIIAGDFAKLTGFSKWHVNDQKKWIEKKFIPLIKNFPSIEFVIVPGNHDICMDKNKTINFNGINWNIAWPSNVHILIDSEVTIHNLKIYGTPYVPIISHMWAFESNHASLKSHFSKIPFGIDILVTHTPPRIPGKSIDISIQNCNYTPFGSAELTEEIILKKPKYCICGHIHSGDHLATKFEDTVIYNVSRVDENYDIAYKPAIICV